MKRDTSGALGFFEDLPVMVFVLAGVASLIATAAWSEATIKEGTLHSDLERLAELVSAWILDGAPGEVRTLPTADAFRALNLSSLAELLPEGRSFTAAVTQRHPVVEALNSYSAQSFELPSLTGCSLRFLNAIDGLSRVVVVEVRVVVW